MKQVIGEKIAEEGVKAKRVALSNEKDKRESEWELSHQYLPTDSFLYLLTAEYYVMAKETSDSGIWILSFYSNKDNALIIKDERLLIDPPSSRGCAHIRHGMFHSPGRHAEVYIRYSVERGKYRITRTLNGVTRKIKAKPGDIFRVLLSPDGRYMVIQYIASFDILDSDDAKVIASINVNSQQQFVFSPDSTLLIVSSHLSDHHVIIDMLAKDKMVYKEPISAPLFSDDSSLLFYMNCHFKSKAIQGYAFQQRISGAEYERTHEFDKFASILARGCILPLRITASHLFHETDSGLKCVLLGDSGSDWDCPDLVSTSQALSKGILTRYTAPDSIFAEIDGVQSFVKCSRRNQVVVYALQEHEKPKPVSEKTKQGELVGKKGKPPVRPASLAHSPDVIEESCCQLPARKALYLLTPDFFAMVKESDDPAVWVLSLYDTKDASLIKHVLIDPPSSRGERPIRQGMFHSPGKHAEVYGRYFSDGKQHLVTRRLYDKTENIIPTSELFVVFLSPNGHYMILQYKEHIDIFDSKMTWILTTKNIHKQQQFAFSPDSTRLFVSSHLVTNLSVLLYLPTSKRITYLTTIMTPLFSDDSTMLFYSYVDKMNGITECVFRRRMSEAEYKEIEAYSAYIVFEATYSVANELDAFTTMLSRKRIVPLCITASHLVYESSSGPKCILLKDIASQRDCSDAVSVDQTLYNKIVSRQEVPVSAFFNVDGVRKLVLASPSKHKISIHPLPKLSSGKAKEGKIEMEKKAKEGRFGEGSTLPVSSISSTGSPHLTEESRYQLPAGKALYCLAADYLAMVAKDGDSTAWTLSLHDTNNGALIKELSVDPPGARDSAPIRHGMFFSPGRHAEAYIHYSADRKMCIVALTRSGQTKEFGIATDIFRVLLSPDGCYTVIQCSESFDVLDAENGRVMSTRNVHKQQHFVFSPDSSLLLVSSHLSDQYIIIDMPAKERRVYNEAIAAPLFSDDSSLLFYMSCHCKSKAIQGYAFQRRISGAKYARAHELDTAARMLASDGVIPLRIDASFFLFYESVFGLKHFLLCGGSFKTVRPDQASIDDGLLAKALSRQETPAYRFFVASGVQKVMQAYPGKVVVYTMRVNYVSRIAAAMKEAPRLHRVLRSHLSPEQMYEDVVGSFGEAHRKPSADDDKNAIPYLQHVSSFQAPPGELDRVSKDYFTAIDGEERSLYSTLDGRHITDHPRVSNILPQPQRDGKGGYSFAGEHGKVHLEAIDTSSPKLTWTFGGRTAKKTLDHKVFGLELSPNGYYLMLKTRDGFVIYNFALERIMTINKLPPEYRGDVKMGSHRFSFSPDSLLVLLSATTHYFIVDFRAKEVRMYECYPIPVLFSEDSSMLFYSPDLYRGRFLRRTSGATFVPSASLHDLVLGPSLSPVHLDSRRFILFVTDDKDELFYYRFIKAGSEKTAAALETTSSLDSIDPEHASSHSGVRFDRRLKVLLSKMKSQDNDDLTDTIAVYSLNFYIDDSLKVRGMLAAELLPQEVEEEEQPKEVSNRRPESATDLPPERQRKKLHRASLRCWG